jgi:O-antigen ligase
LAVTKGVVGLTTTKERSHGWNFRLALICFSAVSVGLPIAWISLAKVLVLAVGMGYLIFSPARGEFSNGITCKRTAIIILVALAAFTCSLLWTQVDKEVALLALTKHAKLLVIPILITLIRNQQEARAGVISFVMAQSFVLVSSWLLAAGLSVPWVIDPTGKYVVFSSYLDQSIMLATAAAVIWHLRNDGLWPAWLAGVLSIAALADTLLLLDGRSGFAVAITMLSLVAVWAVPKRLRLTALVLAPILVLSSLYLVSGHIQNRVALIINESRAYSQQVETDTSSGWRLNAWQRSIQAIQQQPILGNGTGSWAVTVKRLQGETGVKIFGEGNASNPHQEYLLWGVELGIGGTLLLVALLISMALDAVRFTDGVKKAMWSVISALAVSCLFNSALYDDLIGDFFCVLLGLLLAMGVRQEHLQNETKS